MFYFGTQCAQGDGVWEIWNPHVSQPWVHTSVPCSITPGVWHEVRWYGTRTATAYHYSVLEFDGTQYPIDYWEDVESAHWDPAFVVQFQADGNKYADTYTEYVDDVQAWVW